MKAEGFRAERALWQKIGLLNDIAVIAPMLGLLGTVWECSMHFMISTARWKVSPRSLMVSGISVGTTVGGLVVAILSMVFHSATSTVSCGSSPIENEAQALSTLIDNPDLYESDSS